MDDPRAVRVVESLRDVFQDARALGRSEASALDALRERASRDEAHGHPGRAARGVDVVGEDGDDLRVLEPRDGLRFTPEPLREGGVVKEFWRQDLERHVSIERGLVGLEHARHPAPSDGFDDAIGTEVAASRKRHSARLHRGNRTGPRDLWRDSPWPRPSRDKKPGRAVLEYSLLFRLYFQTVNPTPRQKQILDFVTRSIDRRGFAPSIQEICDHFDLASTATVHKHLKNLAARGLLTRESHRSRALEVPSANAGEAVEIPLLGRVAAGVPIEAIANSDTISIPADWLGRGERFALRVSGDSMIDAHIEDGDVVVVERKENARDGDTVIALVDDAEATLKIFRSQADGRVRLEPRNESLKPMVFEASRVRIQGTVVGVLRRYDRRS